MLTSGNQKKCIPPPRVSSFRTILERGVTKLTFDDHSTSKGDYCNPFSGRKTLLDFYSKPSAIFELSNHDLHYFHYPYFPRFAPATFPRLGPAAAVTCLLAVWTQANVFPRLAPVVVPATRQFSCALRRFHFLLAPVFFLLQTYSLSYSLCSFYWSRVTKQTIEAPSLK